MNKFIKKYISHCLVCIKQKTHSGPKQGLLHPIEKVPVPFHTIHLDCTGPFKQSNNKDYKYILIMIDAFTKFCVLKPLKTLAGQELVDVVRDTVLLFSAPSLIITDRGTNFTSKPMQNLFSEWRVKHHMIATGTPRGNGQVERYVKTISDMLSTTCSNEAEWPNNLWKVQLSLNTTIQKSTGFSPIRLLIGRDSNIPPIQARLNEVLEIQEIVDVKRERELALKNLKYIADEFKNRFDRNRRDNMTFRIGDTVYVNQDHRRHNKLKEKFKGPYQIIDILDNDRFSLKGLGNLQDVIIAKDKLRLWPGEWVNENVLIEDDLGQHND